MGFLNKLKQVSKQPYLSEDSKNALADSIKEQEPIKVILCGEINAGKSSFINTLVGEAVLPASITGHTSAIHYCTHGASPAFRVKFRDTNRASHTGDLSNDSLKRYLNESGSAVEFIEVEHPSIPAGFVIIDSPGINDEDPYRDTLVRAFMAECDVLVFIFDINRPVTATEVGFLKGFIGQYRLNNCLFVGNKMDQRKASEYDSLKISLFNELKKYVSGDLRPDQVALMTTLKEKDGGHSADVVTEMIKKTMSQREQTMKDRALRTQLRVLSEENDLLLAQQAKRTDLKAQYEAWMFRANQLIESHARLSEGRQKAIKMFDDKLSSEFAGVTDHLLHMSKISNDTASFQSVAEENICAAVERANIMLSESLLKNPQLCAAIPSLEATIIERYEALGDQSRKAQTDISLGQAGLAISMPLTFVLGPLIPLAIAAWGLHKMHSAQVSQHSEDANSEKAMLIGLADKLDEIRTSLTLTLDHWFDSELIGLKRRIENFLRDLYCVFGVETSISAQELTVNIKNRERQISAIQFELKNAA